MKHSTFLFSFFILFTGCTKVLSIENETFEGKPTISCGGGCAKITLDVPIAKQPGFVSGSINNKVFAEVKEMAYFGKDYLKTNDYNVLTKSFIASFEENYKKSPSDAYPWEVKIKGNIEFYSDQIINIKIDEYNDTGGAHPYEGLRSLLFNLKTGKTISNNQLFKNKKQFTAIAEKEFREAYNIPPNTNINSTHLAFENDTFQLPATIFYTNKGLLLYYNEYEISILREPVEILLPYDKIGKYLLYH